MLGTPWQPIEKHVGIIEDRPVERARKGGSVVIPHGHGLSTPLNDAQAKTNGTNLAYAV